MGMLLISQCDALKLILNTTQDVCFLFPDGAILRKPGSCKETIKCKDGKSSPHTVKCSDGKSVNLKKMTCVTNSAKVLDRYCNPTCKANSPKFIQDPKNCNEWAECSALKVIQTGSCPPGQVFSQDQQRCIYERDECLRSYDICNVAQTGQRFWNKDNCHRYYYCNARKQLKMEKCPMSTFYDVNTGECVKRAQVDCYEIPAPEEGCGTKKLAIFNRFISDQATCRGYFYCKNLGRSEDGNYIPDESSTWGQCPPNEFFDEKTEYCQNMNNVKCDEDRCDGRASGHILSEKSGCQHYLVCKDGNTLDEVKCPDNKFFDPFDQACVDSPVWYPICN